MLAAIDAVSVTIPQATYEVARDDNITIPCTFGTIDQTKLILMQWSIRGDAPNADEVRLLLPYTSVLDYCSSPSETWLIGAEL